MRVEIKRSTAIGTVTAPASKSYAHRLLIGAALSSGKSMIRGAPQSEDILATLDCLEALGAKCETNGSDITVYGCGSNIRLKKNLPCRESGSTLRFLIPIALMSGERAVFTGTERLISRGIGIYEDILSEAGVTFTLGQTEICADGKITSGTYRIRGNVSSQFVTGMLFALSVAEGVSVIEVIPPVESRSYIDITLDVMRKFGINISEPSPNVFFIKGNQTYQPVDAEVEGDFSNSAFLYALNRLGGEVNVLGLHENSRQGDKVCLELFDRLCRGDDEEIDLSDCPDLAPVLFALAAAKHGGKFTGTKRLKIKESDRAEAMAKELAKFGAELKIAENSVEVKATRFSKPDEILSAHNDHRIVMSLSVISTLTGAVIEGAEAVKKSYPDFFTTLEKLGVKVIYEA